MMEPNLKKPLQLENCTDQLQCVFLNDYEKNMLCMIINHMNKNSCLTSEMEILGESQENNILILTSPRRTRLHRKIWENCIDKTCSREIMDKVLQNQMKIMNDILKMVILSNKYRYMNESLTSQQFKEALMPILYLRICFKNIGDNLLGYKDVRHESQFDFWKESPMRNMFINAVINNEILMSYIHFLKSVNKMRAINPYKWKQQKYTVTKQDLINYSSDKYFEHHFNEISQRILEIQKYIPQKLPLHFDHFELNNNICLPHNMLQLELMHLSKNALKAKDNIHRKLQKKLKKVITLEEMLRQIFENDGKIPQHMYLNGNYIKYLVETKSINFVTLKLQKMKAKTLKDCKSLNNQLKYIKKVESKTFKRYRFLTNENDSDDTEKVQNQTTHNLVRCYSDAKLEVKNYCIFNFKYMQPKVSLKEYNCLDTEPTKEQSIENFDYQPTLQLVQNFDKPLNIIYSNSFSGVEENSASEYLYTSNSEQKKKCLNSKTRTKLPTKLNSYANKLYRTMSVDRRNKIREYQLLMGKKENVRTAIVTEFSDDTTDIEAIPSETTTTTTGKKKLYLFQPKNFRSKSSFKSILNTIQNTFKEFYDVSLLEPKDEMDIGTQKKSLSKFHRRCTTGDAKNNISEKSLVGQSKIPVRMNKQNDIKKLRYEVKKVPLLDKMAKFTCLVEE